MLLRADGVIPFAVESIALDFDVGHLCVRHLDFGRIMFAVQNAAHFETGVRARVGYQVHNHSVGQQRPATPVLTDVREQAVFDLVPFTGSGRQVTD